ncbi:hypothetical protein COLO4_13703 [Corchorus olitorius]|uniref:Uncharacterized protein n=1 Tax=Corchorus olitorius TaxID=93759 RepID=A0A1R3JV57_9ROSI|nr:hypothetical protein COLO4_13703 [Corchorus olitorius]
MVSSSGSSSLVRVIASPGPPVLEISSDRLSDLIRFRITNKKRKTRASTIIPGPLVPMVVVLHPPILKGEVFPLQLLLGTRGVAPKVAELHRVAVVASPLREGGLLLLRAVGGELLLTPLMLLHLVDEDTVMGDAVEPTGAVDAGDEQADNEPPPQS